MELRASSPVQSSVARQIKCRRQTMPAGVTAEVKTYQLFINGEWVENSSNKTFPVYDPATEEVIARAPDANADDVNRAVAAARAAFEAGPWATTTAQERGRVLFRLADKIRQNTA